MQLFEVIPHGMGLILVMEYLPLSLYDMLHDVEYFLKETEIKCYMKMILLGVKYMHENNIMHRVCSQYTCRLPSVDSMCHLSLFLFDIIWNLENCKLGEWLNGKKVLSHQCLLRSIFRTIIH